MQRRRRALAAVPMTAALVLAACGSDESTSPTTQAGTSIPGGGVDLKAAGCPDTVVIQTDWMPEAEHGFVYQLVGPDYSIDKGKAYVTGTLIDEEGKSTGVKVQIRSGGAPQQFQSVTSIIYTNEDTLLGYVYTDEAIQNSAKQPTVAIHSGMEKNPQMIMWDPATYPDVETIADLGKKGVKVRYFGGAAYMDYFTSTGILKKEQVDGSYQGGSDLWVADGGKSAQQGFASAEPYLYENEIPGWKKPVKFEYIHDAGWKQYGESIATKPENIEKYAGCFEKLVPLIQHASVDYIESPERTNAIILDAAEQFGADFGWTYTKGTAEFGVKTMKEDGLLANGPDGVVGKFDLARVNDLITKAIPVYTAQNLPPKAGLQADDIVTNRFLDPTIGF